MIIEIRRGDMNVLCDIDCKDCENFSESHFEEVNLSLLSEIESMKVINDYNAGELIVDSGAPILGMFCIQTGAVNIEYENQIKKTLGPGEFIGVNDNNREYYDFSAHANEYSILCFFDSGIMDSVLSDGRFRKFLENKCIL